MFPYRLLLDPTGAEGNGGSPSDAATGGKPDLAQQAANLAAKHGGGEAAVAILLHEAKGYRDSINDLKKRLPADGSLVLSGDDVKAWEAYRTLGKPAELTTALSERTQYKAEADGFRKAEIVREAANIAGYKPTVLSTLVKAGGLDLEIERDDKGVPKHVHVRDGDKTVPVADYAEAHWQDHLPALKADSARPTGTPSRESARPIPSGGDDPDAMDRAQGKLLRSPRYARL